MCSAVQYSVSTVRTSRRLKVLGYKNKNETREDHHTKSCIPGSSLRSHNWIPSYLGGGVREREREREREKVKGVIN